MITGAKASSGFWFQFVTNSKVWAVPVHTERLNAGVFRVATMLFFFKHYK